MINEVESLHCVTRETKATVHTASTPADALLFQQHNLGSKVNLLGRRGNTRYESRINPNNRTESLSNRGGCASCAVHLAPRQIRWNAHLLTTLHQAQRCGKSCKAAAYYAHVGIKVPAAPVSARCQHSARAYRALVVAGDRFRVHERRMCWDTLRGTVCPQSARLVVQQNSQTVRRIA